MDIIRLNNIVLFAHHGIAPQEQELGQRFFLDVEVHADLGSAAQRDKLDGSIDYEAVYRVVRDTFTSEACQLLEHAAWRLIRVLFGEFPAQEIHVRIRKPSARIDGVFDSVEVELSRKRDEVMVG